MVEYLRDYTVLNGVYYLFQFFSLLFCETTYFKSAKKCEMASFCMTSLHVDLNEAAKYVDIITTHIASLLIAPSHTRTKYKMAMIFGLTCEDSSTNL